MLVRQEADSDYAPPMNFANQALQLARKIKDKNGEYGAIETIGSIFKQQGNYPEALKMFFAVLKVAEESGDKEEVAQESYGIGNIYIELGNFQEALKYHLAALKIEEEIGWKSNLPLSYNALGRIYFNLGNNDEATKYFLLNLNGPDFGTNAWAYMGLGNIDLAKGNYYKALKNFFTSIAIMEQSGSKYYISDSYFGIGNVYLKKALQASHTLAKEYYKEALHYFKEGLLRAKQTGYKNSIINAYSSLSQAYRGINDYKNALHYALLRSQLKDSLFNNTSFSQISNLKMQYEVEQAVLLEKIKNDKLIAEKRRRNNMLMWSSGVFVMASIFSGLFVRQRNLKRRAIEKAEATHKMAELEMQSLRSQLNPHFMFNSLNSIQELILMEQNEKSHSYLARFSKLLRMLLDNAEKPFIPLTKELEFLRLYLGLEKLRIPDLQYSISTAANVDVESILIPNLILQPYIENAIWHGLSYKESDRQISIRIFQQEGFVDCEIEDNGVGRKKSQELKSLFRQRHESKGMELLNKRFKLLNQEYRTQISTSITDVVKNNTVTGTLVTIKLPLSLSQQAFN